MKSTKKPLPCSSCGGKCCNLAPFTLAEFSKIESKCNGANVVKFDAPKPGVLVLKPDSSVCFFLNEGRCSIYSYRPEVCRAIGNKVPCPKQQERVR